MRWVRDCWEPVLGGIGRGRGRGVEEEAGRGKREWDEAVALEDGSNHERIRWEQ